MAFFNDLPNEVIALILEELMTGELLDVMSCLPLDSAQYYWKYKFGETIYVHNLLGLEQPLTFLKKHVKTVDCYVDFYLYKRFLKFDSFRAFCPKELSIHFSRCLLQDNYVEDIELTQARLNVSFINDVYGMVDLIQEHGDYYKRHPKVALSVYAKDDPNDFISVSYIHELFKESKTVFSTSLSCFELHDCNLVKHFLKYKPLDFTEFENLKFLEFCNIYDTIKNEELLDLIQLPHSLEELIISNCDFNLTIPFLEEIPKGLKILNLYNPKMEILELSRLFKHFSDLEMLNLSKDTRGRFDYKKLIKPETTIIAFDREHLNAIEQYVNEIGTKYIDKFKKRLIVVKKSIQD